MKIIAKDNFDRDHVSETLVAENVPSYYAPAIAGFLNERFSGNNAPNFYVAVPDNHKLYIWEP
jgi:hypothetical protein